jgi:hypothetical protein
MAFKLIKSKNQFSKHIKNFKHSHIALLRHNTDEEPEQYPCLCHTYIIKDINGFGAKNIFVYKKDFKLFNST